MIKSGYHDSVSKRFLDIAVSVLCLAVTLPISLFVSLAIAVSSKGGIFFTQKRVGKNGKIFKILKFRTMVPHASQMQNRLKKLNEADGPVFKIYNDPRFTWFGKILSRTGLDEIPQFINVLKGEMSVVGPRPLPVSEAIGLTKEQKTREEINPGITSSWVIKGSHKITFEKWMKLDKKYVKSGNFSDDISIIWRTILLLKMFILKL